MTNPIADPIVEIVDSDVRTDLVRISSTPQGAVTVTLSRPHQKNALDSELVGALREAVATLAGADGVRVVFLTGAGGNFSVGADLRAMPGPDDLTEADIRDSAMQMATALKHLHDLPVLTVALVEGEAGGGGAGLAAACDMTVATANASFAFPEARFGLVAATISPYVAAAVGARRARALFARGASVDAYEAMRIGLVDEIAPDAASLADARDRIAAEAIACAPDAVAAAKRLVADIAGRPIDHGMMGETARVNAHARMSAEGREGVHAALAGGKPSWAAD